MAGTPPQISRIQRISHADVRAQGTVVILELALLVSFVPGAELAWRIYTKLRLRLLGQTSSTVQKSLQFC